MNRALEIELFICGIEISEPYNGDSLSIQKVEVEYQGSRLTNCLRFQYRVSVTPNSGVPEQIYINRVLLEEVDLFLQSLSLLLVRPTRLIMDKERLDNVEVKLDLPPRDAPVGLYNIATWWNRGFANNRYSCKVYNNGWPVLEKLLAEFRQKPYGLRKQLAISLHWFAKGSDELSSLERLMAFWICFNALYVDSAKREQEAIESYLRADVDTLIGQHYVQGNDKILQKLASLSTSRNAH